MDAVQEYWRNWIGYYVYLSERTAERWKTAADRMRREDYKLESMISDTMGFWSETAMASLELWRGQTRAPQTVIFSLDIDDESAGPKYVPLFLPSLPSRNPSFVWLRSINHPEPPAKHRIEWKNLYVKPTDDRTGLEIKLLGLSRSRPLAPATYRAMVHVDEVPVAEVFIVVRESRRPASDTRKAASGTTKPKRAESRKKSVPSRKKTGRPESGKR